MSALSQFIRSRNPDDSTDQWITPHPDKPTTAQKTRHGHEPNGHHVYETDTGSFDATRSSTIYQDHAASDGFQDEEEYGQHDEQALSIHQENGPHVDGAELDALMSQMHQNMKHPGHVSPSSYPPTTSGEPDLDEDSGDDIEVEHSRAQRQVEQPHDLYTTKMLQRQDISTPLVIHSQSSRIQQARDQFKVATRPTISQKDVQHQKKSQGKIQAVSQSAAKHVREPFQATPQTATTHQLSARVLNSAHQQSAHAQIIPARHHQQHAIEADRRRQQYTRQADHQNQYHDECNHQQHYDIDESPKDNYEQNTHSEEALDYNLEDLYAKDFVELQDEPFDGPPHGDLHDTPSDFSKSLSERLAAVAKLDVHRQKELFASLKLEQWEEAGDWFQERFSEVFGKLKAARKTRREIASQFEQRIAHRQQALTKKRKITDDALSDMKKSGSLVLESTPRKKQKSTE
ncbi:hypothetical protein QM012_006504 [Aureobasidium pullulans]|uniref:Extracellular mutant protein 11 C-terminal domain-containing protein n=1 Tax=Aureobasidium pullulans TaxID=5580 RepID=A0ABR0TNS4_AURPU